MPSIPAQRSVARALSFPSGNALPSLISFLPSIAIIVGDLNAMGADIRSYREPLTRAVKEVMIPSFEANFEAGGRPEQWEPLSMEYTARKLGVHKGEFEHGGDVSHLTWTGTLRRATGALARWQITQETAQFTNFPAQAWYGIVHQLGHPGANGGPIPARPFIMFQPDDEAKIEEIFGEWLDERVAQHWSK